VVSRYKPGDPFYEVSEAFFTKGNRFLASPVTLFEIYSVISRVDFEAALPGAADPDTLAGFILEDCHLEVISRPRLAVLEGVGRKDLLIPLEYLVAARIASGVRLRALDLLHIAYASMLGEDIDGFVTCDEEILRKRREIRRASGVEAISLKEVA
jgi:predicted nucleic acid-binding protein